MAEQVTMSSLLAQLNAGKLIIVGKKSTIVLDANIGTVTTLLNLTTVGQPSFKAPPMRLKAAGTVSRLQTGRLSLKAPPMQLKAVGTVSRSPFRPPSTPPVQDITFRILGDVRGVYLGREGQVRVSVPVR